MKTQTVIKNIVGVTVSLAMTSLLTACPGKSKDKSSATTRNTVTRGCVECTTGGENSDVIMEAYGMAQGLYNIEMGLTLFADSSEYVSSGVSYNGPVVAEGMMIVDSDTGTCHMSAGEYEVRTVQPGKFGSAAIVTGLVLEARNLQNGELVTIKWDYGFQVAQMNGFYKWDYDNVEYAYGLASQFNVTQITGQQGFGCSPYPGLGVYVVEPPSNYNLH